MMEFKGPTILPVVAIVCVIAALALPAHAQSGMPVLDDQTRGMLAVAITAYILPSVIALYRKHPSKGSIVLVNLFLGFTGIGWLWALIWSFGSTKANTVINNHYRRAI